MGTTIVCGVDGSSEAQRAASVAARLACDLGSRALLVHVEEDPHKRRLGLRWPRLGRARRRRKVLRATAEECCFPSDTTLQLRRGDPTAELMDLAEKQDAELVVVSARGRSTANPALLGGTASALMRSCPCPVVVVPTKAIPPLDAEGMRSVVCGVEGRETDVRALRLAADLATRLGGGLHAVHGYETSGAPTPVEPAGSPRFNSRWVSLGKQHSSAVALTTFLLRCARPSLGHRRPRGRLWASSSTWTSNAPEPRSRASRAATEAARCASLEPSTPHTMGWLIASPLLASALT